MFALINTSSLFSSEFCPQEKKEANTHIRLAGRLRSHWTLENIAQRLTTAIPNCPARWTERFPRNRKKENRERTSRAPNKSQGLNTFFTKLPGRKKKKRSSEKVTAVRRSAGRDPASEDHTPQRGCGPMCWPM
jgi:hypothetical protein